MVVAGGFSQIMRFDIGSEVLVRSMGRRGTVVEALAGSRYRVALGSLQAVCPEHDLQPAKPERGGGKVSAKSPTPSGVGARSSVDLHGLTVEEALRLLEETIDRALLAGSTRLEVVHGIGSGRVRRAVHRYLRLIDNVARFEPDARNPGVTWVVFR
jgi:DNA mismatch repair protein MutS2